MIEKLSIAKEVTTTSSREPGLSRDGQLFVCLATVLVAIGVVMAQSASMTSRPSDKDEHHLTRHAIYLGIGLVAATVAALTPPDFWRHASPWIFGGTVVLLMLVLVPGIGTEVNGARRWLRAGPVSMQPSEIAKLALPMLLARLAVARQSRLGEWIGGTIPVIWPAAIVLPLVLLEPDLGTTLFLAAGAGLLLFLAGWPLRNFFVGIAAAMPVLVALVLLQPYQLRRLSGFVAAWSDPSSAPYQIRQSLITLGSGGLTGTGLGRGWQKLSFLPEANTDFVFAVVGEELGLVGTLGVLLVWMGIFAVGLKLLVRVADRRFEYLCGLTLLVQLVGQALVNMAVVTALLPPKGIALPLVSYGGSNLVTSLAAIGLILGFSRATQAD